MNEKIQNDREIHLHMNKKQIAYQNLNITSFYYLCLKLLTFLFCMTWGPKKTFLVFIVHRLTDTSS